VFKNLKLLVKRGSDDYFYLQKLLGLPPSSEADLVTRQKHEEVELKKAKSHVALNKMFRNNNMAKVSTKTSSKGIELCDRFINTLKMCGKIQTDEEYKKQLEIPEMDNDGNIVMKGQVIS